MTETPREELRMYLSQAKTRAENDATREHVARALDLVDCLSPTPLDECPLCPKVGPRPVVRDTSRHDCPEA